jgi:c-di-GMP-binding flagellar brake protein YcgR
MIMSSDTPNPSPNGQDRREYYRINVTLPIRLQPETDDTEGEFTEKSVNLSGGGIGVVVETLHQAGEILTCSLLLPDQVLFKSPIEVLRLVPIAYPGNTYRLHARFIRMTTQNRELLIKYVLQFQRYHLARHYSV